MTTDTPVTKEDEQYALAQRMTDDYNRVLNLCEKINDREGWTSEPWDPELVERIIGEHIGDPLDITATLTGVPLSVIFRYEDAERFTDYLDEIEVTLGTGGPAHGITFRNGEAFCWHQDWFTPRVHDVRELDNADILASRWGIEDY